METVTANTDTVTRTETLVVKGIDFKLLERQRQALITMDPHLTVEIFGEEIAEALNGLLNMLDTWADERDA